MARVKSNVLTEGLSGKINNQLVFKTYSYGTITSKVPDMSNIIASDKQKTERSKFKDAVAYAKAVIADPQKKAAIARRTPKGKLVYHQAIREYLASH